MCPLSLDPSTQVQRCITFNGAAAEQSGELPFVSISDEETRAGRVSEGMRIHIRGRRSECENSHPSQNWLCALASRYSYVSCEGTFVQLHCSMHAQNTRANFGVWKPRCAEYICVIHVGMQQTTLGYTPGNSGSLCSHDDMLFVHIWTHVFRCNNLTEAGLWFFVVISP